MYLISIDSKTGSTWVAIQTVLVMPCWHGYCNLIMPRRLLFGLTEFVINTTPCVINPTSMLQSWRIIFIHQRHGILRGKNTTHPNKL